ncbi:MAG: DNA-binding protein [Proteobacteria bacterium]|nr:DNA-binding protein [Pseudomonadota bacterium]
MGQYDFTLKFALGRPDADPESFIEPLMNEGCDDALIGIGKLGRIALDFTREANSAEEAVLSALADVKRAIPEAEFIEATPDFVGVPDIAKLLGVSRQYIGKILKKNEQEFPVPTHGGVRAIWHLEDVLTWLVEHQIKEIDDSLLDISRINMRCNHAREHSRLADEIPLPVIRAVG